MVCEGLCSILSDKLGEMPKDRVAKLRRAESLRTVSYAVDATERPVLRPAGVHRSREDYKWTPRKPVRTKEEVMSSIKRSYMAPNKDAMQKFNNLAPKYTIGQVRVCPQCWPHGHRVV